MAKIIADSAYRVSKNYRERLMQLIAEKDNPKIADIAKEIKISKDVLYRSTVYAIIPSLKSLIKIADYFEVSLSYLLAKTDENDFIKAEKTATFKERLNLLCNDGELKFSKIAKKMTFSVNLFYEWQRENTLPNLDYLEEIAAYFKVSLDYLLGRTDYKD